MCCVTPITCYNDSNSFPSCPPPPQRIVHIGKFDASDASTGPQMPEFPKVSLRNLRNVEDQLEKDGNDNGLFLMAPNGRSINSSRPRITLKPRPLARRPVHGSSSDAAQLPWYQSSRASSLNPRPSLPSSNASPVPSPSGPSVDPTPSPSETPAPASALPFVSPDVKKADVSTKRRRLSAVHRRPSFSRAA